MMGPPSKPDRSAGTVRTADDYTLLEGLPTKGTGERRLRAAGDLFPKTPASGRVKRAMPVPIIATVQLPVARLAVCAAVSIPSASPDSTANALTSQQVRYGRGQLRARRRRMARANRRDLVGSHEHTITPGQPVGRTQGVIKLTGYMRYGTISLNLMHWSNIDKDVSSLTHNILSGTPAMVLHYFPALLLLRFRSVCRFRRCLNVFL